MLIVSNEKEYAENCLISGDLDSKPYKTLTILAKYYYHHLGYRKKKIIKHLTKYLTDHYPRYQISKTTWDESIEKIANNAGKYPLYEIDQIWITQAELDTIEAMDMDSIDSNEKIKLLAFALLCLAKLNQKKNLKSNGWVNLMPNELIDIANLGCTRGDCLDMLGDMGILGMLEFPKKNGNLSNRVCYINNDSKKVLPISDFRALGNAYLKYKGANIVKCSGCDILIPGGKTHSSKYCIRCRENNDGGDGTRVVTCIDCGDVFRVPIKNNRTCRCDDCNAEYRRAYKAAKERERRSRQKTWTEQNNT